MTNTLNELERLDLRSSMPAEVKLEQLRAHLRELLPEAITENGRLDFDLVKLALGEAVDVGKERYGINWRGKAECFRTIQAPSLATLRPCANESVSFDTTKHLIIEGDNLEVLKLLQKSYLGKIKMIYIDPPYNTGKDFVYPDDYRDSLSTYLRITGQVGGEGKRLSTNVDTSGRYHSTWLTMMWPRLYLARQLLTDDGVLFVSIDDNEEAQLRLVLDEIFGEENRVSTLVWDLGTGSTAGHFTRSHETVLCYSKNKSDLANFAWRKGGVIQASALKAISRLNPASEITFPKGMEIEGGGDQTFVGTLGTKITQTIVAGRMRFKAGRLVEPVTLSAGWAMRSQILSWITGKDTIDTKGQRVRRFYFSKTGLLCYEKERTIVNPKSVLRDLANTADGSADMSALGFSTEVFDFPKPTRLVRYFAELVTDPEAGDIVLDFFAGSGTAAHAVLDLNREDTGNRKFILVQLPEPTDQEDFPTLADVCKERIRRVIKKFNDEEADQLALDGGKRLDRGFRVFKLAESNFKAWATDGAKDEVELELQLELHVDHVREGRTPDDLLYEILLKGGFPLTASIETLQFGGKSVYSVAGGALIICLERELTLELIRAMAERKPERVVCLDEGFAANDQLKANAVQFFKTNGVASFKTV
jgi:adenine-specific DNA-methyltransferase